MTFLGESEQLGGFCDVSCCGIHSCQRVGRKLENIASFSPSMGLNYEHTACRTSSSPMPRVAPMIKMERAADMIGYSKSKPAKLRGNNRLRLILSNPAVCCLM